MKGYATTFLSLFDDPPDGRPRVAKIQIPIIQRDFAQGRDDDATEAMRERFVDRIVLAATTNASLGLDFVYGEVDEKGVLQPLDGQQRLTTLYLLHWYVASRAGLHDADAPWLSFSYRTRLTARDFTRTLAEHPFPGGEKGPKEWITDQSWFSYPWRQDPTINSMVTMLDAIHERLDNHADFPAVWRRLSTPPDEVQRSAIWFLFLPVIDMEHGEDLYIKMNSRGKPLTTFEIFKADFEAMIEHADPGRHRHLVESLDGAWADTLWEYEKRSDGDFKIDEEFERYLTFIIEICEWRDGNPDRKWHHQGKVNQRLWPLEGRARMTFADPANEHALRNRDFFFFAFDTWVGTDPRTELERLFTAGEEGHGSLPLFSSMPDLFGACIVGYGTSFSVQETLLLFGVLLARQAGDRISPEEVARRLRSLRNVSAAFLDRERYMSSYVASTARLMVDGDLELEGFRGDWVADEELKWEFLDKFPAATTAVRQVEDTTLLRGRIMAFELDASAISARAQAFATVSSAEVRDLLGAALLTKGDYSRVLDWRRQLGSSVREDSWTDLLTTGSRAEIATRREPLMMLLDDVVRRTTDPVDDAEEILQAICDEWIAEYTRRRWYDWRYYFVRYGGARSNQGDGLYCRPDGARTDFGFRIHMLHGKNYQAKHTDALLRAAFVEGAFDGEVDVPTGWRTTDAALTLKNSRVGVQCEEDALAVVLSEEAPTIAAKVGAALARFGVEDRRIPLEQRIEEGRLIDSVDRVQMCVSVVNALLDAGL